MKAREISIAEQIAVRLAGATDYANVLIMAKANIDVLVQTPHFECVNQSSDDGSGCVRWTFSCGSILEIEEWTDPCLWIASAYADDGGWIGISRDASDEYPHTAHEA